MIALLIALAAAFAKIGVLTLGGGMAMLPLIRREMLVHGWMTEIEFLEILGVSEVTPGPLAVNAATFVGWRVAGLPGAAVATLSLVAPSLLCVVALGFLWRRFSHHAATGRVLDVLRPVVAALILAAALRLLQAALWPAAQAAGGAVDWRAALVAGAVCAAVLHGRVSPVAALLGGSLAGAWLCG